MLSPEQFQTLIETITSSNERTAAIVGQLVAVPSPQPLGASFTRCSARYDGSSELSVDAFLDSVNTFKQCTGVSDENALLGLTMLLTGEAANWWQGQKGTVATWNEAQQLLRIAFGPNLAPHRIYRELFALVHPIDMKTEHFVTKVRMLFSQLPRIPEEEDQLDMLYGGIHLRIRERLSRDEFVSYDELVKRARVIEATLQEKSMPASTSEVDATTTTSKPLVTTGTKVKKSCNYCHRHGHSMEECRIRKRVNDKANRSCDVSGSLEPRMEPSQERAPTAVTGIRGQPVCWGCHEPGHLKSNCPKTFSTGAPPSNQHVHFAVTDVQIVQPTSITERMYLPITVQGYNGTGLVDGGSTRTVASVSLYELLCQLGCRFHSRMASVALAGDSDTSQEEVLVSYLPIYLSGRKMEIEILFLPRRRFRETILGIDFLREANVDCNPITHTWCFRDDPGINYPLAKSVGTASSIVVASADIALRPEEGSDLVDQQRQMLNQVLADHAEIFSSSGEPTDRAMHRINTGQALPISQSPYRIQHKLRSDVQKQLDEMLADGIIEECESPWAAPLVIVPKKTGGIRLCVDYRQLNAVTKPDRYPLPRIEDLLHATGKAKFISTIDLQSGYWQVPVHPDDVDKTSFTTQFGMFRFRRMPFGLRNAPATFQRLMDQFRRSIPDVVLFAYLDDLIVLSETFEGHLRDLELVFRKLKDFCLRANRKKCSFVCPEVSYLGHLLTPDGIKTDPEKVKAIMEMPQPTNPQQVQVFMQTCSWYRRFIPKFSEVIRPLSMLTRKHTPWQWSDDVQGRAFRKLRELLSSAPILRQADDGLPFTLCTDASSYAIGAALLQGEGADERPVEYASRLLSSAERNYSTTEREALAIKWALDKFRGYVEYSHIVVKTDHQALRWLMSLKAPAGRLARWILALQHYDLEIVYIPGSTNVVADTLSRPPIVTEPDVELAAADISFGAVSAADLRKAQQEDPEVRKIAETFETASDPVVVRGWTDRGYLMSQGLLYRYSPDSDGEDAQFVVPVSMRKDVMAEFHDAPTAGHYGVDRTYMRIVQRYYWPGMRKYIADYIHNCVDCQRYKPTNLKPAGLLMTPAPSQRFEVISVDLFGPLPETASGNRWILIVEDLATRWVELFPLRQATAEASARVLVEEICLRYGTPRKLISDNGVQFISSVMQCTTHILGIQQSLIPVYHPEANPVERKNRDLKTQLAILVGPDHLSWDEHLAAIRFAMNTCITQATGFTPAYLVFGSEPRAPGDVARDLRKVLDSSNFVPQITPYLKNMTSVLEQARDVTMQQQDRRKACADRHLRPSPDYQIGDLVWVKTHILSSTIGGVSAKLAPRRDGPYVIVRKPCPVSCEIASPEKPTEVLAKYHVSDLTPYRQQDKEVPEPVQAIRSRGRPRKAVVPPVAMVHRSRGRPSKKKLAEH